MTEIDDWVAPAAAGPGQKDDWMAPAEPKVQPTDKDMRELSALSSVPSMSRTDAALRGAYQGVTGNFGDELTGVRAAAGQYGMQIPGMPFNTGDILGLARLGYEYLAGSGEATERYENVRDRVRHENKLAQQEFPGTYLAGNVAGALATPVGRVAQVATLPGRIAQGVATGAGYGALYGAGEGETGQQRLSKAGSGALLGAGVGAAAPVLTSAIGATGRAIYDRIAAPFRGIRDPEAEASRRVASALATDLERRGPSLSPEELAVARQANSPLAVVDAGGERTRALARSAANTSPEARAALESLSQDRFHGQSSRVADFVQNLVATPGNATRTREAFEDAANTFRRPFYNMAYREGRGGIMDDELWNLSQAPAMQSALKAALEQGKNRMASGRAGPLFTAGPDPKPTLEFWDLVQRQLGQSWRLAKRQGAKEDAMELNDLRTILVNKLDQATTDPKSGISSFARARGVAAELFKANDAIDAGEKFFGATMRNEPVKRVLAKMSPEERTLFAEGYVSRFIEKVRESGDNRNILNTVMRNPAERERLNMVVGPQKAKELEAFLQVERVMDRARAAVSGNSTTARQLMELGLAGGAGGLLSGDLSPQGIITGALLWKGARMAGSAAARNVDAKVAERVGEMLASSDPKVIQKGVQILSRNNRLMDGLRGVDDAMTRVGSEQSPKTMFLPAGVPARAEDNQKQ